MLTHIKKTILLQRYAFNCLIDYTDKFIHFKFFIGACALITARSLKKNKGMVLITMPLQLQELLNLTKLRFNILYPIGDSFF